MQKILLSIPDDLAKRMRASIPNRQRSMVIAELLEAEVKKREEALYQAALTANGDKKLNEEIKQWDKEMFKDGLSDETW